MLYLEDYLELIEHLPEELRDRFTDIRERDLLVHNSTEQLKEKAKLFFAEARKLKPEQRKCDYERLLSDYQSIMRHADDKVQIASQMQEIMMKLDQRLDTELEKFKLELEADHSGITEELEKRSLELDADSRLDDLVNNHLNHGSSKKSATTTSSSKVVSGIKDRRRSEHKHRHHPYHNNQDNGYHGRAKLSHHEHNNSSKNPLHHNNNHYNNHHQRHHGSVMLQDAGSCRQLATPSPTLSNAGYPSSTSSVSAPPSVAGDLNINGINDTTGHYGNNLSSFGNNSGFKNSSSKNNINLKNINSYLPFSQQHSALSAALASNTPQLNSVSALAMMNTASVHNKISNNLKGNDLIDPGNNNPLARQNQQVKINSFNFFFHRDETKYCICRQISYGEMVACDNDECENEWFHYDCVGITQPPEGKWFCPDCTRKMTGSQHHHQQSQTHKKRGRKEKSLFNLVNNSIDSGV